MISGVRSHFVDDGLQEIRVPTLMGASGSCEHPSSLFGVGGDINLFLTQTGQLSLERFLDTFDGVWCHTSSYRNDAVDARHIREFELIEEEVSTRHSSYAPADGDDLDTMFEVLLRRARDAVCAMIAPAVEDCPGDIAALGGNIGLLEKTLESSFPVLPYTEALALLDTRLGRRTAWGSDLQADDEMALIALVAAESGDNRPVFVTKFPEQLKYFNMQPDTDEAVVYSADLLLPDAGESVGAAIRGDDPRVIGERFDRLMRPSVAGRVGDATVVDSEFENYFAIVKSQRLPRHAGFGIGLERVLQFVTARRDIRQVSVLNALGSSGLLARS